ncbi:PorP/SprF family type IX secretion system membrane protein [Hymenobacter yonginensis]|uniref:PorP/SprF family type IX secretion system membrane protein n=1 Tax=Hymenobacter yonginensis TaxID=748197 RepID=A0ABY7PLB1_9BACT|nr:PorP/SprF family type IX secretion system membrane protein [Hymenobacter yonginensis]WBO84028.1 PorP/SprF family type IX secretion system membrane protein [Hymenobacter yonginensis]
MTGLFRRKIRGRSGRFRRPLLAAVVAVVALPAAAQDLYFAQPYANRLHQNPAFAGLLDDASVTLSYRNQFPTLAGTFTTSQLAADYRLKDQHNSIGLLLNHDRTGGLGYTRFEVGGLYAYQTRLNKALSFSGGLRASYGNQRISYGNLVFGDQLSEDGTTTPTTAEPLDFNPVSYLSVGTGVLLYSQNFWVSVAGHHLNQPDLGFRTQGTLPIRYEVSTGYKHYFLQRTTRQQTREISVTPTAHYVRQGGSERAEAGLYATVTPLTLGAVYRGIPLPGAPRPQQILTAIAGVSVGSFRVGYAYDVALSSLSADLGGAHEITLTLRAFDSLDAAWRRLKRRNSPAPPWPSF